MGGFMVYLLLVFILSCIPTFAYEHIWGTDFPNEETYGYYGDELYLPSEEWSIDLRGVSLTNNLMVTPDWFRVENGVLQGVSFECSKQLETVGVGVIWKSRLIELDSNKSYYIDYVLETTDNWNASYLGNIRDFIRLGYYDDNQQFILLYEQAGDTERGKISGYISNTSECQLVVEVDCNSKNQIFKLRSVNLYYDTTLGDSSQLIITKLCSPEMTNNDNNRYIQITNIGNHLIDLSNYNLESIHSNRELFTWELKGFILPGESLVIGDQDTNEFFCDIGKSKWSSKSVLWGGIPANNDGAQLVLENTREVTDRVVGVNFYEGYAVRKATSLLATTETNNQNWDYYAASNSADSNPGEYIIDDTLPISFYSTNFSFTDSNYFLNWTTFGEANLIGYNLLYAEDSLLSQANKINSQIILAQNSVQYNNYSFSLNELDASGYLWIEVVALDEALSYSNALEFHYNQTQSPDIIEVVKPFGVTLFPNPSSHSSSVKITNPEKQVKGISVYNIKGQLVGKLKANNTSGVYDIHEITEKLSSGIYFVSTKFETNTVTRKLIITK